jgi:hypothetical protein
MTCGGNEQIAAGFSVAGTLCRKALWCKVLRFIFPLLARRLHLRGAKSCAAANCGRDIPSTRL